MSDDAGERRRAKRRVHVEDHGIVAARVRPGREAVVVDVSAGGALIESPWRLLPGTVIELQLETASHRLSVRGLVLRCRVARLRPGIVFYQGAIAFDCQLGWLADTPGMACPRA